MISKIGSIDEYKILVTGAAGFLGHRLVEALLENGAFVVGVDYGNHSTESIADFMNYESFQYICGSFYKKSNDTQSLFLSDERKENALFHMAGLANIKECETDPSKAFESNVLLTYQALEFCRLNNIRKFIFPSTGLVYGNNLKRPATEEDPPHSKNLYVASKVSAEALIQGYAENFNLSCRIARLGNVYGPEGNRDTVVGTLVTQAKNGQDIFVHDLTSVRDFIYIDDVVEALLHLLVLKNESKCFIVNVSTGIGTSVKKLAETICKIVSIPTNKLQSQEIINDTISSLVLDNTVLTRMTGWKPKYNLSEGLSLILK